MQNFLSPEVVAHRIIMLSFGAVQDGKLRVFKWPSMEIILSEAQAHTTVKQLDFRFARITAFKKKSINLFYL